MKSQRKFQTHEKRILAKENVKNHARMVDLLFLSITFNCEINEKFDILQTRIQGEYKYHNNLFNIIPSLAFKLHFKNKISNACMVEDRLIGVYFETLCKRLETSFILHEI